METEAQAGVGLRIEKKLPRRITGAGELFFGEPRKEMTPGKKKRKKIQERKFGEGEGSPPLPRRDRGRREGN